jgi:hypothetical protein
MSAVHLASIQREFVALAKEARDWNELSLEEQRKYLKRHPGSKRRLTGKSKGADRGKGKEDKAKDKDKIRALEDRINRMHARAKAADDKLSKRIKKLESGGEEDKARKLQKKKDKIERVHIDRVGELYNEVEDIRLNMLDRAAQEEDQSSSEREEKAEKKAKVIVEQEANVKKFSAIGKALLKLKGKKVKAFGPGGQGLWGDAEEEQEYKISEVKWETGVKSTVNGDQSDVDMYDKWIPIRVYLEDYRESTHGLVYTDKTFKRSLKSMMKKTKELKDFRVSYTEQGMQGRNYVSLDVLPPRELRLKVLSRDKAIDDEGRG